MVLPSPLRVLLGAVVALVVVVVAWLPPILHFFTGPVGPAIGGFLVGRQFNLSDKEAGIMGVLVALAAGVPVFITMDGLISNETFALILAIAISLWSGGLATVAAWFAGGDEEAAGERS